MSIPTALGAAVSAALVLCLASGCSSSSPPPLRPEPLRDLAAPAELRMGTAVSARDLERPRIGALIREQFSSVTPENEMKWATTEPSRGQRDWSAADRIVQFAEDSDQLVRGHVLVWDRALPAWLTDGVADGTIPETELREILRQHILATAGHFRGRVWQWDVVNEVFSDPWITPEPRLDDQDFWVRHLGAGIVAEAFRWAHEADPAARLFYNDYGIEELGPKSDALYDWVTQQLAAGVPIHGIGFQTHLSTEHPFPPGMQANLERFADLGLDVALTEVDVRTHVELGTDLPRSPERQAAQEDLWRRTLAACLAVPRCISYTTWGVSDRRSWIPDEFPGMGAGLLYDADLAPKPQYAVLQDELVGGENARLTREGG